MKNFYKLTTESEMFTTQSTHMNACPYNLVMIKIPDLLVGFYKRGNVKEKLPDIKPIAKSEFGPLSYVTGYVLSKMFRKSKAGGKETAEKLEGLQALLLSMKSMHDNEYIDVLEESCGIPVII